MGWVTRIAISVVAFAVVVGCQAENPIEPGPLPQAGEAFAQCLASHDREIIVESAFREPDGAISINSFEYETAPPRDEPDEVGAACHEQVSKQFAESPPEFVITDSENALVAAIKIVDQLPQVIECGVPEDHPRPPNGTGVESTGTGYPSADVALQAFLDANTLIPGTPGFAKVGYVQLIEPDGSISFGKPFELDDNFVVTLIAMTVTDRGWAVERWEGSGC